MLLIRYDFFQLPDTSPAMLTHSVELRVAASFSSDGYGQWAAARPELLLLKARRRRMLPLLRTSSCLLHASCRAWCAAPWMSPSCCCSLVGPKGSSGCRMQGDLTSQPDAANYTFKQIMQNQNTTYEIDLCPSQLKQVLCSAGPLFCVVQGAIAPAAPRCIRVEQGR